MTDLPAGWLEGVDPTYKRPYYFHKKTRRSTWTKPTGEETLTPVAAELQAVPVEKPDVVNKPKSKKYRRIWIEVYSPEHQRTYFFNRETKESRWTKPADMDAVNAAAQARYSPVSQPSAFPSASSSTSSTSTTPSSIPSASSAYPPPPAPSPALKQAWEEIELARRELQKEREEHVQKLRSEWKILQSQLQHLRDLTISSSFSPANGPREPPPSNKEIQQDNKETKYNSETPQERQGDVPADSAPKNTAEAPTTSEKVERNSGSYTAGLLSELEEYAEFIMQRRESIHSRARRASLAEKEQSKQMKKAARKAYRSQGEKRASDSDASSFDGDVDEYISQVLGGLHQGDQKRAEDVHDLIPLAIELDDLNNGMIAVKAEAEAVGKARVDYSELDEGCYYRLLGVSPDATNAQLKKAYHKAMIVWHPDKYQGPEKDDANKKSSQIAHAYQVLTDEWERSLYDMMGLEQYMVHSNVIQCFINYLVTGCPMKKHPRKKYGPWRFIDRQFVKRRLLWLSTDHKTLNVAKKRNLEPTEADLEHIKQVRIDDITDISKGIKTEVLEKTGTTRRDNLYLSIISSERTLDLEAPEPKQREFIWSRLTLLVIHLQKNKEWLTKFYEERNPRKKKKKKKKAVVKPPPSPPEEDE